jgi:hypothetical protein
MNLKKYQVWDIGKALINDEDIPKEVMDKRYRKYSLNRYFSKCFRTIYVAENANLLHHDIPNEMHAEFYSASIPNGTKIRGMSFNKKKHHSNVLPMIMQYFDVNKKLALQYEKMMKINGNLEKFESIVVTGGKV